MALARRSPIGEFGFLGLSVIFLFDLIEAL